MVNHFQIDRRIQAFIKKKRDEVDDINVKEFCHRTVQDEGKNVLKLSSVQKQKDLTDCCFTHVGRYTQLLWY